MLGGLLGVSRSVEREVLSVCPVRGVGKVEHGGLAPMAA